MFNKLALLSLPLILIACTLDYTDANLTESISEDIPNTIIYKYLSVEAKGGNPVLRVQAVKAEIYDSKEETHLDNVTFFNLKNNEIESQGRADSVILNLKTGDAELKGSIAIESEKENSSLLAESLQWKEDSRTISSSLNDMVTIKSDKGSTLNGSGFSADLNTKTITFTSRTEGRYNTKDE